MMEYGVGSAGDGDGIDTDDRERKWIVVKE